MTTNDITIKNVLNEAEARSVVRTERQIVKILSKDAHHLRRGKNVRIFIGNFLATFTRKCAKSLSLLLKEVVKSSGKLGVERVHLSEKIENIK